MAVLLFAQLARAILHRSQTEAIQRRKDAKSGRFHFRLSHCDFSLPHRFTWFRLLSERC